MLTATVFNSHVRMYMLIAHVSDKPEHMHNLSELLHVAL